mgnify:CR=1 FL=1
MTDRELLEDMYGKMQSMEETHCLAQVEDNRRQSLT